MKHVGNMVGSGTVILSLSNFKISKLKEFRII